MSLSGARGLIRVAHNPTCELQAAMAIGRVSERALYQALAGAEYPGEYGERISARRRGTQFEANLYRDDARLLRETLAPVIGGEADALVVRNLVAEVRGASAAAMAERSRRTSAVLGDLAGGLVVPDLLIQPQLRLSAGQGATYIAPDALALSRADGVYLPVEIKSFIVRDGVVDASDRDSARRQAAVELLALRQGLDVELAAQLPDRALFVFATPFGLRPAPAFAERLEAELYEMRRALDMMAAVQDRLQELGITWPLDVQALAQLAPQLAITYQERCVSGCLLSSLCRERSATQPVLLGDMVADVLGVEISLPRALALLQGAAPASAREQRLAPALRDAAAVFGWAPSGRAA